MEIPFFMLVILGLGSNKSFGSHSCMELLSLAVGKLGGFIDGLVVSSVYKTAAMYVTDQDDFYNMVVSGDYSGTPRQLLEKIHEVEAQLGRDRSREIRNGPRSIDIDIEMFGRESGREADLVIPHERLEERAFVLKPLLEIAEKDADKFNADIFYTVPYLEEKLRKLGDQRIERISV